MIVNPFSYLIEKLKSKVSKSGDTMTGQLRIDHNSDTPLVIKKTNASTGKVYLGFENSAETIGYFSVGADKKPYFASGNGTDKQIALTSDLLNSDTYTGNSDGYNGVNTNIKLTDRIIISAVLDGYTVVPCKNGNIWRFQIGSSANFPSYPSNTSTTITYWYLKV